MSPPTAATLLRAILRSAAISPPLRTCLRRPWNSRQALLLHGSRSARHMRNWVRPSEAIAAFREALARTQTILMARRSGSSVLARADVGDMPANYVREVFDQYATRFDDALTRGLSYKGPELVVRRACAKACDASGQEFHFSSMLDLGCGTGLGAVPFRPFVDASCGCRPVTEHGRTGAQQENLRSPRGRRHP